MGMNNFIRADRNPKMAMYTMFLGAGSIRAGRFIYHCLKWDGQRCLATILAQCLGRLVVAYFLVHRHNKLQLRYMKLKLPIVVGITSVGIRVFPSAG